MTWSCNIIRFEFAEWIIRIVLYRTFASAIRFRTRSKLSSANHIHSLYDTVRFILGARYDDLIRLAALRRSTCMALNLHRFELSISVVNSISLEYYLNRTLSNSSIETPIQSRLRLEIPSGGRRFSFKMLRMVRYDLRMYDTDRSVCEFDDLGLFQASSLRHYATVL